MSSPSVRRSARAPKPNPRFEDEVPWNEDTLRLLRHDSDSSDRSSTSEESRAQVDQDVGMEDLVEDEESEGEEPPPRQNRSFTHDLQTPSLPVSDQEVPAPKKHKSAKTSFRLSRKEVYPQIFGPNLEDLYPILQTRDLWHLNPRDLVFTSRTSLREAIQLHVKGEYLEQQKKQEEFKVSGDFQQIQQITRDQALAEGYLETGESHDIVLGPRNNGQKFTLRYQEPFQIAQARLRSSSKDVSPNPTDIDSAYQKGWMLNLGARPTNFAWAPCSTDDQFLAITFRCSKSQRDKAPLRETKIAPAFSPSTAYPSRIEIWRIKGRPGSAAEPSQLDHHTPPRLVRVICVKYGNILKMEWLSPVNDSNNHFLCVLTTDGNIRVIRLGLSDPETPVYLQIDEPQFTANPPANTVFTSFTLPNPKDLIATDAAGAIHLFSLISDSYILAPYATIQIHMTYIMSISSIPSHPHFICTSSAAGEYILTDLRSPAIDRVRVQTARLPTRNLSYLPFTRTFLTTLDSSGRFESTSFAGSTVVSHNLRDFKLAKPVLRLPDTGGIATCLATSPFHPIIAVGNASGSVFTSNYVRRCLPIANARAGVGAWMVKLFEYEWRGLTDEEKENRRKERDSDDVVMGGQESGEPQTGRTVSENDMLSTGQQQQQTQPPQAASIAWSPSLGDVATVTPPPASHPPNNEDLQEIIDDSSPTNPSVLPGDPYETPNTTTNSDIDIYHGPSKPHPGISRISESFRPYKVVVSKLEIARGKGTAKKVNGTKGKGKLTANGRKRGRPRNNRESDDDDEEDDEEREGNTERGRTGGDEEGQGQVIYREEQAVSCIAWNGCHIGSGSGNVRFSSWLAVGWGSGVVRIVDLGHDVV